MAKKAQRHAKYAPYSTCLVRKTKNAQLSLWKRLSERINAPLRVRRFESAVARAQQAAHDTEELLVMMAAEFPVEASVLSDAPRNGFRRVRVGQRNCIIIGGA